MAAFEIPRPRSRQQTLGEILNVFTSRYGIPRLKVGGPLLTGFEAVAQSQMRCTQDIWNLLDLSDFNRLEGSALDYRVAEEGMAPRFGARPATGRVNFSDPRFQRISTRIYSGAPPPAAGAVIITVADASAFTSTGSIYIGRGTINAEGPLAYSSIAPAGQAFNITLSAPATKFHNLNEDVVLAQGGNRNIGVGTGVSTGVDGRTAPISYSTTAAATILDGEVLILDVPVICRLPGSAGDVPRGAIKTVSGEPFPSATCINELDFTNGTDIEQDDALKERLRAARSSRSRGTATAILYGVKGLFSSEDQKRVLSASLVQPAGEAATLYIDDGNGYEETNAGTAYETLADAANGGEREFAVSGRRPVAKAFVKSSLTSPYALTDGAVLRFAVGGVVADHTFSATEFTAIAAGTSYEVVSSINGNPALPFSARTADNGTRFSVFARENTAEDVECQQPDVGETDANDVFGFSTALTYTMKLYKNDILLFKDGRSAVITSEAQSAWGPMATGVELNIAVDRTPAITYVFTDADFVAAATGFTTVSHLNTLASWVAVINAKIPGITVVDGGGFLSLASNLGPNARAGIVIGSTVNPNMVSAGCFTSTKGLSSYGFNKDFTLNRLTGDIKLATSLAAGDTLTVGSYNTRAAVVSVAHPTSAITLTKTARLWVSIDGDCAQVATTANGSTTYTVTNNTIGRSTYTASTAGAFSLLKVGDVVIIWDTALVASGHGAYRVAAVPTTASFIIEKAVGAAQAAVALTDGGLKFFRCANPVQDIRLQQGTDRTLTAIASEASAQIADAVFEVFQATRLRLRTNAYVGGRVTVLAADIDGQRLLLPLAAMNSGSEAHVGTMLSANPEVGTPAFITNDTLSETGGDLSLTPFDSTAARIDPSWLVYFRRKRTNASAALYGNVTDEHYTTTASDYFSSAFAGRRLPPLAQRLTTALSSVVRTLSTTVTVNTPAAHSLAAGDIVWMDYSIGATPDANFLRGMKVVASVPTATRFTYAEAGANTTCAAEMHVNLWDGSLGTSALDDDSERLTFVRPYAIGAYGNLNVTLNQDNVNQSYDVPLYRRGRFNVATLLAAAPLNVVDVDGGVQPFSTAFGNVDGGFFRDFHVYMRSRTVTHKNLLNKGLIWRLNRFGPEGDNWRLRYVNPTTAAAGLGHSLSRTTATLSVPPSIRLDVRLPSGAARVVANIETDTRWTWTVSTASPSYDVVVFQHSQPVAAIAAMSRTSNLVTVTTTTVHGFTSGQIVNLVTSADVNFPTGAKLITVLSTTSFRYPETGSNATSTTANVFSSSMLPPNLSQIVVGDIMAIANNGTSELLPIGSWRVYAVDNIAKTITVRVPPGTVAAQPTPRQNGTLTNLQFFPINTAASTAALIKAYADASMSTLLSATLLGTGATAITDSTEDEFYQGVTNVSAASVAAWRFLVGLNWVQESNLVSLPNTLTLKYLEGADADAAIQLPDILSTDVANEQFRLVPATTSCLKKWLSSPAVSGIYAGASFDYCGRDGYLQATTRIIGTGGAVSIEGGLGNRIQTPILTTGENLDSFYGQVTIGAAQALGIHGSQFVALANTLPTAKSLGLTTASTVSLAPDGTVVVDSAVWTKFSGPVSLIADNTQITIHRVGRFTSYRMETTAIALSGADIRGRFWRFDVSEASAANRVKSARIVNFSGGAGNELTIWVENENGVNETIMSADDNNICHIYTAESVQPGDVLSIGFPHGNISNQGQFVVKELGATGTTFKVDAVFANTSATPLGVNVPLFQVTTAKFRLIEEVGIVAPLLADGDRSQIVLKNSPTSALVGKLNPNLGAVLTALDKLEFPDDIVAGTDGYSSSTGLIGETVKTLYGDENAPTIYPGLAAVGSTIYVAGPNIKRIKLSLQIRLRSGAVAATVTDRVRAAITSEINRIPHSKSVAIGRIVKVTQGVQGVFSAVVLSPSYTSSSDVIAVQANEKARILDANADISISVVGQ